MNKPHVPARPARIRLGATATPAFLHARLALVAVALGGLGACGADAPGGPAVDGSPPVESVDGVDAPSAVLPGEPLLEPGTFDDGYLTLDEALALAAASGLPLTADLAFPGVSVSGGALASVSLGAAVPHAGGPAAGDSGAGAGDSPIAAPTAPVPAPAPTPEPEPESTEQPSVESPRMPGPVDSAAPPTGASNGEIGQDVRGTIFTSNRTEGFTGEVLEDGRVRVAWRGDRTARGYNVYRGAKYVTTVYATEWIDETTWDGDFYYEIEAFDFVDDFTRIATGLTVPVRGTGRMDPEANLAGTPQLQDYELVFAEEFDGNALDLGTWNTSYLWGDDLVINEELQHYVDIENEPDFGFDPFEVADGSLTITSVPTPPELSNKANGQPYLSGVITSYDAFKFTYGYAEARAKVPYGQGLWAAFWLLNAYYGDDDPEIDIMEHLGDDQDVVYHTYHYYDGDKLRSTKSHPVPGTDYTNGFHTYAVDWRPGLIVFYVDGKETHRVTDPRVSDQEMYLIANTALGGWWPGSPDGTTPFPASYEIDYIRVFQKNGPFDDAPVFDDPTSSVPYADAVLGASPNHRPPFELWPEGYPTR